MRPDYRLCDKCGAKAPEHGIFVETDRGMDGAGSMATTGVSLDLCPRCCQWALENLLKDLDFDEGKAFVEWLNKKVPVQ